MKLIKEFTLSLVDPKLMPTAVKVALVVGSILFTINHGRVLVKGEMNRERWLSGGLTYLVPYFVSIHGQYISGKNNKV
jgi:hypothetical protein